MNRVVVDPEQGTIDSPLNAGQVEVFPWVPDALARLRALGYGLSVVTNQPSAGKGKTTRANLDAVHARVLALAGGSFLSSQICFHRAEDRCGCRKPLPGMLEDAFRASPGSERPGSWMIGDGITDIQAGAALGLRTAYLGGWKCDTRKIFAEKGLTPDFVGDNLLEFVDYLEKGAPLMSTFSAKFLEETQSIIQKLDVQAIEAVALGLAQVRARQGRLFILGVGGSAGHASHAVNDFRKICSIESYAPTDNVSELTARTNDEGWDTTFSEWLKVSHLGPKDGILIFSVGGGNREKNVSVNLVRSVELAKEVGASVYGIVGKDGGYTALSANACVVIPPLHADRITPHTEGLCAVVWHLLVSHPALAAKATKWETVDRSPRV